MRHSTNSPRLIVCLLTCVGLLVSSYLVSSHPRPAAAQAANYIVTDLGTIGGVESRAFGINFSGRVVGESDTPTSAEPESPFAWTSGAMTDIGNFGGGGGAAHAVNDIGYAVGSADLSLGGATHAFIWSDIFGKRDIGTLGGSFALAVDINNANQVVGQSDVPVPGSIVQRAFVWTNANGMQQIATLGGASNGALGINDNGEIVGFSSTASGHLHGFMLSGGVLTDIPTLGGQNATATEITNGGQVVGHSTLSAGSSAFHAFLWTAGAIPDDLGTLGGANSFAWDINNVGQIVGQSQLANGSFRAFIYSQTTGIMTDLNALTSGSGWTLLDAREINEKGQIVGTGINPSGLEHAFLLTPNVDDIPGGEPPPCAVIPSNPIVLPATNSDPIRQNENKTINQISDPRNRRRLIYDLLRLF